MQNNRQKPYSGTRLRLPRERTGPCIAFPLLALLLLALLASHQLSSIKPTEDLHAIISKRNFSNHFNEIKPFSFCLCPDDQIKGCIP
jgi:hypothetical protein